MRRSAAAVVATAAATITITGIAVSADVRAVRADVTVAGERHPLDVHRIRIIDGLRPGGRYRLPAFGVRNHRGSRTAYRLVASARAAQANRRPQRAWLHFVPAVVVIDAGRSRPVGVRLQLPRDAEPGVYDVVLGVRPGGPEGARLTFRVESAASTRVPLRQAANVASWALSALLGAALVVALGRSRRRTRARVPSLPP